MSFAEVLDKDQIPPGDSSIQGLTVRLKITDLRLLRNSSLPFSIAASRKWIEGEVIALPLTTYLQSSSPSLPTKLIRFLRQ